jgi:hypothetical protein
MIFGAVFFGVYFAIETIGEEFEVRDHSVNLSDRPSMLLNLIFLIANERFN